MKGKMMFLAFALAASVPVPAETPAASAAYAAASGAASELGLTADGSRTSEAAPPTAPSSEGAAASAAPDPAAAAELSPGAALPSPSSDASPPSESPTSNASSSNASPSMPVPPSGDLLLYMNSARMEQGSKAYTASRPLAVKAGVSYGSLRSLAERLGFSVAYVPAKKETVVRKAGLEARFTNKSKYYTANGIRTLMKGAAYTDKGVFMVPLTSITAALQIPYTIDQRSHTITLKQAAEPAASFTVQAGDIIAGETRVQYKARASSPSNLQIVQEKWEGRQEVFAEPGIYPVTYQVQDAAGRWSKPYTLSITVTSPNIPPVAMFSTDKKEYRMGEPVVIADESTDEENAITDRQWTGKQAAYFRPGPVTVSLTVTDKHGAAAAFSQEILITDETLYAEDEFNRLFTPVGSNFPIDGTSVKNMELLPFTYDTEPYTLFRSTGPESIREEGVLYQDVIDGPARILLHHKNTMGPKLKIYMLASNPNPRPATLFIESSGMAGPTPYGEIAGQMSLQRYFASIASGSAARELVLAPGETRLLFQEIGQNALSQGDIVTFQGEVASDSAVKYTSLVVKADRDPLTALPSLPFLDPNQSIVRGTFADSTRIFDYAPVVGTTPARIYLTDNNADPFQTGYDGIKGTPATNSGNYGVLYKIVLERVAPHTLLTFNPRGGLFRGSALVNGSVVTFSHLGAASATDQNSVLYRTGAGEESVEIRISPAAGSNLPFCLLLSPLPSVRS
ncbi:stalk domain-containing protein [Paenibacillus sp. P22]|uniref:stalk domain-containing protein n=1 Tax=Paenibacillus sp. P22 TaxID=483908 RepID=UPI0004367199|nr:stalk domain-containing protein [Paenibacillus sp. P22]CDN42446.1 Copper amine oxidase domain protein [Paenibacillus sp. P22]